MVNCFCPTSDYYKMDGELIVSVSRDCPIAQTWKLAGRTVARKFSIGGLCSCEGGGFSFVRRGWTLKNESKRHLFIVFHISILGLGTLFGGG